MKIKSIVFFLILSSLLLTSAISAVPAAAAPPAAPALAGIPTSAYVSGVVGRGQSMPLSCESRSAADLANFWGINVSENEVFNTLPKSDNPDKGFVGDVYGTWGQIPPNPYGVHAKPIAQTLQSFGLPAEWHRNLSFADLKAEIAAGRPAIVWVIGGVWSGTPIEYTSNDGHSTIVAAYEHSMIMIGYDENYVYLINAGDGRTQTHTIGHFKDSWAVLGNMAVTANLPDTDPPTQPNEGNIETYVVKAGDYLTKLAKEWGIDWRELAYINDIVWPYTIHPGQIIKTGKKANTPTTEPLPTSQPEPTQAPAVTPAPTEEPTAAPTAEPTEEPASKKTYTVQSGDHLMQIARNLQLNWQAIATLNNLSWPYTLHPGQVLKLPGKDAGPPPAPLEGNEQPTNNQQPATETPSGETYTVQRGDYLVALARQWGIDWRTLAALNQIDWPYIIYPGQVLKVP